jgi:hypothetical protein
MILTHPSSLRFQQQRLYDIEQGMKMIMNDEHVMIWNELVLAYSKVLL